MVQKERRPSQVVTIGYQQSGHQGGHQSGYQTDYQSGYQNGYPIVYQSGHQKVTNNIPNSVKSAKKSIVYRVPIQLEWQPSKGKVVTETTTEYKEAATGDDSGFSDFGPSFTSSSSPFQLKRETKEPESSSSSSEDEDYESESAKAKFQIEGLDSHNKYRQKHGVAPLKLDKRLCSYAQEWANKLAREDSFEHRTDNQDFGENLYCSWSSNPKAKCVGSKPVDSWYSEISKYTFGSEPTSSASGHFTQVVWKRTEKLGIAKAKSAKSGKIIVVANYEPAGNWIGQYKDNVPPPTQGN